MAEDDPLVQPMVMRLFTSLQGSGGKPEFHLYRSGRHGFSMRELGTSEPLDRGALVVDAELWTDDPQLGWSSWPLSPVGNCTQKVES
jgi:hypothetical protein